MSTFWTLLQNSLMSAGLLLYPIIGVLEKSKKKVRATLASGVGHAEKHTKCNNICLRDFKANAVAESRSCKCTDSPEQCPCYTETFENHTHTYNKCTKATPKTDSLPLIHGSVTHIHPASQTLHSRDPFPLPPILKFVATP